MRVKRRKGKGKVTDVGRKDGQGELRLLRIAGLCRGVKGKGDAKTTVDDLGGEKIRRRGQKCHAIPIIDRHA